MLGVFDLLFSFKRSGVVGDLFSVDHDLQVVRIGQDLTVAVGKEEGTE